MVVCTEQFLQLAQTIMRAQRLPESARIMIAGNPEIFEEPALARAADAVAAAAGARLAAGTG